MDDNTPNRRGGGTEPEVRIFDPFAELRQTINERIDAFRDEANKADKALASNVEQLKDDLNKALKRQENTTNFVIIVMVIGFLVLLFALASILITSWQTTQSLRDALQTQQSSTSKKVTNQQSLVPNSNTQLKITTKSNN